MPKPIISNAALQRDPLISSLFTLKDPTLIYCDLLKVGHGSSGQVFYAYDNVTNEAVAVKKMAFTGKDQKDFRDDIIKEIRFLKEAQHPNIVQFINCYLREDKCWLVLEYCLGSAADILEALGTGLRESEIAEICVNILEALKYIHALGRIHRDIKSGNILMSRNGGVKLGDFGSLSSSSPAQTFVGTAYFMAPELITAMEDGHYTTKVDVWALGITCIELAETRPPLYSMNAMAALYQIAMNPPPTLEKIDPTLHSSREPWSEDFVDFLKQCLIKEPTNRTSAAAALKHSFFHKARPPNLISDLVARAKDLVASADNAQFKKFMHFLDENTRQLADSTGTLSFTPLTSQFRKPVDTDNALDAISTYSHSPTNSVISTASIRANGADDKSGTPRLTPSKPDTDMETLPKEPKPASSDTHSSLAESDEAPYQVAEQPWSRNGSTKEVPLKPQTSTLRLSKFSTLRTTKSLARQQDKFARCNYVADQMALYKHLRQMQGKELKQLEEKCRNELDALRGEQYRELEKLSAEQEKARGKAYHSKAIDGEKSRKDAEAKEKKLRKEIQGKQASEMRSFSTIQDKEYNYMKDQEKIRLKKLHTDKREYERVYKETKDRLLHYRSDIELGFKKNLEHELEEQLRRHRRGALIRLHGMEEALNNVVFTGDEKRLAQKHSLLKDHHYQLTKLEENQIQAVHDLKFRHLIIQHEAEKQNQAEYTNKVQEELRRTQAQQTKKRPRELKLKENEIRKQYRQAVKIQAQQFKLYSQEVLRTALPHEAKELTQQLKEDQHRKLALLTSQYDTQVENMIYHNTTYIDDEQQKEAKLLATKLADEEKELASCQEKQKEQLTLLIEKASCWRLKERIAHRLKKLEHRLADETKSFHEKVQAERARLAQKQSEEKQDCDRNAEGISTSL
ncbi:unnamed protein product, partial [Mesorhabditis spiculigera]